MGHKLCLVHFDFFSFTILIIPMKQFFRFLFIAVIALVFTAHMACANTADDAKTFFSSGEVKFGKSDFKGAITDFTKAIELNPKLVDAYNSRAAAKFSSGDKQGALADFTKAIELNPKSANTYNNRGSVKSDSGDNQGAMIDFSKAIAINHSFVPAYLNRAAIKLDNEDKQGAIADLLQAAKLGSVEAQQWLKSNGISKW